MTEDYLYFGSDYLEGAHERVLERLIEVNRQPAAGYGSDSHSERAYDLIRQACDCPHATVHFFVGGTQTNATVIRALLRPYQGVLAPDTGHINVHEAGAIELGGHKVLSLPSQEGKLTAQAVENWVTTFYADANHPHSVYPGLVYVSQPTELGTLYSLAELEALSAVCRQHQLPLFIDGARLAYALGSPSNDVSLADLARLTDVFYIGGTKCGTLLGEAVVISNPSLLPHFFTVMKQGGAVLAKGRVLGAQFEVLFEDGLYQVIGRQAVAAAQTIQDCLVANGYELVNRSVTNQVFVRLPKVLVPIWSDKVQYATWELAEDYVVARLTTAWSTRPEQVTDLCDFIAQHPAQS